MVTMIQLIKTSKYFALEIYQSAWRFILAFLRFGIFVKIEKDSYVICSHTRLMTISLLLPCAL